MQQVGGFLGYSGFFQESKRSSWYNGNIVESGVKHHNTNPKVIIHSQIALLNTD